MIVNFQKLQFFSVIRNIMFLSSDNTAVMTYYINSTNQWRYFQSYTIVNIWRRLFFEGGNHFNYCSFLHYFVRILKSKSSDLFIFTSRVKFEHIYNNRLNVIKWRQHLIPNNYTLYQYNDQTIQIYNTKSVSIKIYTNEMCKIMCTHFHLLLKLLSIFKSN